MVRIVVPASRPTSITETPPPLLERLSTVSLTFLDKHDKVLPILLLDLLQHGLMLHHQSVMIRTDFGLNLLLLLHLFKELFLLLVLHHLLPGFLEAWQDLLLFIKA